MDFLSKVSSPPKVDLNSVNLPDVGVGIPVVSLPDVSLPGVNLPGVSFLNSGKEPELPVTDYVSRILLKTDPSDILPPIDPEVSIELNYRSVRPMRLKLP